MLYTDVLWVTVMVMGKLNDILLFKIWVLVQLNLKFKASDLWSESQILNN